MLEKALFLLWVIQKVLSGLGGVWIIVLLWLWFSLEALGVAEAGAVAMCGWICEISHSTLVTFKNSYLSEYGH